MKNCNDFFCEDDSYRYDLLKDNNKELTHRVRISWSLVSSRFQRVLLTYSAGNKLDEVNTLSDVALRELQRHKSDFNDENSFSGNKTPFNSCYGV